ncbi:MAG: hypothetical protein ABL997_00945 [Planctomycetota bacterium]
MVARAFQLSERARRVSMRVAWGVLLIASSLLVGLRIGRPAYYTDGARELPATDLAAASMLQWERPEPVAELPGPVQGRVARLDDGRVLYGRIGSNGTADLVTWDPSRPSIPPESVHGLNSDAHEQSPAVDAQGRVWFASDRAGGSGGYDLYVAPRLSAIPSEVAPVAACASPLDELEPAPSPDGSEIVFVRSDGHERGGEDGELWRWVLGEDREPSRLFAVTRGVAPAKQIADREPCFTADGAGLWFVRRVEGSLRLVRSSRLLDTFAEPLVVGGDFGPQELRSPAPSADGRTLFLVVPPSGDVEASLWYAATAREVYPWWPGQRWLEWVLLVVVLSSLVFLVLLHYGRRWSALDLVAQCLLLSLLLHVLLFLLLKGVEIANELPASFDDGTGFEVTLVRTESRSSTGDGEAGSGIAEEVRFQQRERSLLAAAPAAGILRAESDALSVADGEWTSSAEASVTTVTATLVDAPTVVPVEDGIDEDSPLAIAAVPATQQGDRAAAAAADAARVGGDERTLEIATPGSRLVRAARPALDPSSVAAIVPTPTRVATSNAPLPEPALRDRNSPPPVPASAAASEAPTAAPAPAPVAVARADAAVAPVEASRAFEAAPATRTPNPVAAPQSALSRASLRPTLPSPSLAAGSALPRARAVQRPLPAGGTRDSASQPSPAARVAEDTKPIAPRAVIDAPLVFRPLEASTPQRASEQVLGRERALAVTPPASQLVQPLPSETVAPAPLPVAAASAYSNRFGPAKVKALESFGGTDETERAVRNGLQYLASRQNEDGSWGNGDRFDGKYGLVYVGKTALCVLAFLGAGHSPNSNTEHSAVVRRAVQHLLELQDEATGAFGESSCYGHGISTYAIAECYGMTKDESLLRPLKRALTWIIDNQGPRRDQRNRGGWGYFSPGLEREDDYARVSVSAWMIMALESARLSGIELPDFVLPRAREYLELSYDKPNGWFRYSHEPSRLRSSWPTLPASTPAAAFCLQLLGVARDDSKVEAATTFTVERRPQAYKRYSDDAFVKRGQGNVYFWYYGTLCCFLRGGDEWASWNERLRTVLPAAQAKDGSFQPIDVYAEEAGDNKNDRSYTTAMCVLSLEIYYRYFTPLLIGR